MTPFEFAAELDGWRWRNDMARTHAWEVAYLGRVKDFPDLGKWLDPPRTKRLSPEQAAEADRQFREAVAASDQYPVRPQKA